MQISTEQECCTYVEAELAKLVQSRPAWHPSRDRRMSQSNRLSWVLGKDLRSDAWYALEADLGRKEFLIWFGNHQVGAGGLHWIMRPAVHVAFHDLSPRGDPLAIHYSVSDVLDWMIRSLEAPSGVALRFEMNTFSLT